MLRRIGRGTAATGVCGIAVVLLLAAITSQSYHWDSISGGVPQVATTPRTTLPGTTLTTITWNPAERSFYQVKTIDSVDVQCTLVATFSRPFATWTAPPGTVTTLSRTGTDSTIHYTMPFVTAGDTAGSVFIGTRRAP
jgi:hypothetical protein